MIAGISHMTFIVKDLEKSSQFFTTILDAKEVYSSGNKQFSIAAERFFLINDIWICVMQGVALKERTYNHIAFQVPKDQLDMYIARIEALQLDILPGRTRVDGEGKSIYFYDYDNHLFELHAGTLDERLQRYNK